MVALLVTVVPGVVSLYVATNQYVVVTQQQHTATTYSNKCEYAYRSNES